MKNVLRRGSLRGMSLCVEKSGQLSLLFSLVVIRLLRFNSLTSFVAALVLYVLIVDGKSLIDLGSESRLVLDTVVKLVD
jgi:hypothetical protein